MPICRSYFMLFPRFFHIFLHDFTTWDMYGHVHMDVGHWPGQEMGSGLLWAAKTPLHAPTWLASLSANSVCRRMAQLTAFCSLQCCVAPMTMLILWPAYLLLIFMATDGP